MNTPATTLWFAAHELRLAWRDALAMLTGGKRRRAYVAGIGIIGFVLFMHAMAFLGLRNVPDIGMNPSKTALVFISGSALLAFALMISQSMESVTRAFYTRSDLDLILSSPASARRLFSLRIVIMAAGSIMMALLLAGPFINVMAFWHGARWLSAYGVVLSMGAASAALAVGFTVALFRTIGARRTRLIAQVVAAIIGAAFVIGLQVGAILSYGNLSRFTFLQSDALAAHLPDVTSFIWWPARAMLGDIHALAIVFLISMALLFAAVVIFAPRFGDHALAAAGIAFERRRQSAARDFRAQSQRRALRRKEWRLLARDPWLMSQTLMQILYLLPPAILLWRNYGEGAGALVILIPVLVMAAGQLAGGLAWLAISGEDAPELVATAPVPPGFIVRGKIEAVLGACALVFSPLIAAILFVSPMEALIASAGITVAVIAATMIQLWFRAQAKRSHFRRRHTSSRVATFAEAFSSISWAGTAALVASGSALALLPAATGVLVLAVARGLRPRS
ncbi:MAG TPA: permease [Xanthobacteraceae bacterium]|nr:permease [Xanthobacteraceae bacterium]